MYFINYDLAKEKRRKREFSDRQLPPYFVLFFLLFSNAFINIIETSFNKWDLIFNILSLATAVLGILYAYKKWQF